MSAVWPSDGSFAFTSAPWTSRACTAPGLPVRAAVISAVSPDERAAFGFAPAFNSLSIMAALPFSLASSSGVIP
jgi:hypothetical protein